MESRCAWWRDTFLSPAPLSSLSTGDEEPGEMRERPEVVVGLVLEGKVGKSLTGGGESQAKAQRVPA